MTFRPLTPEEHASLYAEMQRPAVSGYADEPPEERGWRITDFLKSLVKEKKNG